eukprot:gb/GECH01000017.1/.p1 GENE.gb/GECH01000017.1/~~gb/GECH01000017.1/.p1  ORF type:complete len:258 (+),score=56.01 gb/GECH01000017.1/:1-774(+)
MGAGSSRDAKRHQVQQRHIPNFVHRPSSSSSSQPPSQSQKQGAAPKPYVDDRTTDSNAIPTVFRWPHGGRTVQITGSFNNWKQPLPMSRSTEGFVAILNLNKGKHQFKFLVDGIPRVDPNQEKTGSGPETCNLVKVEDGPKLLDSDTESEKNEEFTQEEKRFEETKKSPPKLPPHVKFTPLNSERNPYLLPIPLHVTLNHTYFAERSHCLTLGMTQRYKSKFSTMVIYKPHGEPKEIDTSFSNVIDSKLKTATKASS